MPHDNMPPYREVYIWECTEITDEEEQILGNVKTYTVTFNPMGGSPTP